MFLLLRHFLLYTKPHCGIPAAQIPETDLSVFSDRFFDILKNYVSTAARNGMNMLLTPAFTPPLDTPLNCERMTVQLVGVERETGRYRFDFSLIHTAQRDLDLPGIKRDCAEYQRQNRTFHVNGRSDYRPRQRNQENQQDNERNAPEHIHKRILVFKCLEEHLQTCHVGRIISVCPNLTSIKLP